MKQKLFCAVQIFLSSGGIILQDVRLRLAKSKRFFPTRPALFPASATVFRKGLSEKIHGKT